MKDLRTTDWEKELQEDEVLTVSKDGNSRKTVLLRGLQRLAREAGIISSKCQLSTVAGGTAPIFQCVYEATFNDGSHWVGTADSNSQNTNAEFFKYPTAVSESRAEARCLRKALGIHKMLSSEELDLTPSNVINTSPKGQIAENVIKTIEALSESRGIEISDALEACLEKSRAKTIYELSQLTVEEGQKLVEYLNGQPSSRRKSRK